MQAPGITACVRFAAGWALACSAAAAIAQTPTTVAVRDGRLEGVAEAGVTVFRGIPFAAAPAGDLRWRAPAAPSPWSGLRTAAAFGKACPQNREVSLDQAGDPGPTSEDCLFLNVWTPRAEPGAKLPVMVWIHGGAFIIGSGSQKLYDGAALARRGVVVVTFNYRLGALGFFSHPALGNEGAGGIVNFALLDQIAALRWVRDNVASFGGDPANVTAFGESAGGQSVLALFTSPMAEGLFARGIAQSPYGIPSHTRQKARAVGVAIATAAGLPGAGSTAAQLRALPADDFNTLAAVPRSLAPSLVAGDAVLPRPVLAAFQRGSEARLPLIVGNNSYDASVAEGFGVQPAKLVERMGAARIVVRRVYPDLGDDAALGREVANDVLFSAYARRIAFLHSARAPTWRYYFGRVAEGARAKLSSGVPHGGEIAAVFDLDDACGCLGAPLTEADRAASHRVADYWTGFARNAIPVADGAPAWPTDGRKRAETLEFGTDAIVPRTDFRKRQLDAAIGALNLIGLLPRR